MNLCETKPARKKEKEVANQNCLEQSWMTLDALLKSQDEIQLLKIFIFLVSKTIKYCFAYKERILRKKGIQR